MTAHTTKTLFLPGAGGSASFWKPVADRLGRDGTLLAWPGLGNEPAHPDVNGIDDLVHLALRHMTEPVDIVAQSMGGLVAIRLALAAPSRVNRLVLAATSGGIPVADLGGADWRTDYFLAYPGAARWIADPPEDLSAHIPSIAAPTLLLWGDRDPVSPLAVGQRLASLLRHARLQVVPGGNHDLAQTHATFVADAIAHHLAPAACNNASGIIDPFRETSR
ncbi:alpha/beta fold hydrolase [Pigmentiphaga sp. H8]|uniref:alpha/beta fold hydrolase n=1 Tax=unclassified Pigmentiphaga TaxID=2626614 RepID=UPI000F5A073E|nr:alpha/beta fold hydrolase [Pigmentiphaga sp. H8]AZG09694.1 alpha/beta fold hydrolase [Pigmentiphaga sp. H8]